LPNPPWEIGSPDPKQEWTRLPLLRQPTTSHEVTVHHPTYQPQRERGGEEMTSGEVTSGEGRLSNSSERREKGRMGDLTPSEAYRSANGSNSPSHDPFSSNMGEERENTSGTNGTNGTSEANGPLTFSAKLGQGNRIYIPRKIVQQIGANNTIAAITIRTLNNQVTFLAKMHEETHERRRIVVPTYIRQHLQIKRNDKLKVNIRIPTTNRPTELFQNDKIDL
jgi:hypothetical protein